MDILIPIIFVIGALLFLIIPISQIVQRRNESKYFDTTLELYEEALKRFGDAKIDVNIPPQKRDEYINYNFVIISSEVGKIVVGGKEFSIKDITDYNYSEELSGGTATIDTNMGSAIGRGMAGAIVGGGVGALIGTGTAKKEAIITPGMKKREITIYLNDLQCPYVCYVTLIADDARLILGTLKYLTLFVS